MSHSKFEESLNKTFQEISDEETNKLEDDLQKLIGNDYQDPKTLVRVKVAIMSLIDLSINSEGLRRAIIRDLTGDSADHVIAKDLLYIIGLTGHLEKEEFDEVFKALENDRVLHEEEDEDDEE